LSCTHCRAAQYLLSDHPFCQQIQSSVPTLGPTTLIEGSINVFPAQFLVFRFAMTHQNESFHQIEPKNLL